MGNTPIFFPGALRAPDSRKKTFPRKKDVSGKKMPPREVRKKYVPMKKIPGPSARSREKRFHEKYVSEKRCPPGFQENKKR